MAQSGSGANINTVFIVAMSACAAIGLWGVLDPDSMTGAAQAFTSYLLNGAGWMWLAMCSAFLILGFYMAFGPYANIRLGRDDEEPEFDTGSWIAMLFAGGMGSGLLVWGAAEPMYHFVSPPGMEGETPEAAREALVITNLHWGLHAWSIYGMCALVIAYFTFRRGEASMISTPIKHVFKGATGENVGKIADILGVISVVFGLAGSLAMGALAVRSGMFYAFGTGQTLTMSMIILVALFVCYMLSATTGVDKGIKILSNINMVLTVAIMLMVIFAGPTQFIMEAFVDSIGNYFSAIVTKSFTLYPFEGLNGWTSGWTLTYLIWWLAWGPFIGIFVARISRGRTIREFVFGVVLVPTLFSMLWFAAFGGAGFYIEMYGGGGLKEIIFEDVFAALFAFLGYFPGATILAAVAAALLFIFLVTSADSGTFVLSMMTTEGNLNPPVMQKMIWGVLIAVLTFSTLIFESAAVAKAMAITGAIPFALIVMLQIVGFMREIRKEVAPPKAIEARGRARGRSVAAAPGEASASGRV